MGVLDTKAVRSALAQTGARLRLSRDVEILIVGGAAGMLTGELPATWTTADVDVIRCHLPQDRDAVLDAAAQAGRILRMPPSWLSEDVALYAWALPKDWERRRIRVGQFGRLRVYAIGRQDLIAMKFLAHRARDLEHLVQMEVTPSELRTMQIFLDELSSAHPEEAARIAMARQYVAAWGTA